MVEILDLFAVTDINPHAVRGAAQSLLASKKYTALIKFFTIFSSLEWSFVSTIKTMTKSKDWSAAELFAKTFGGPEDKGNERPTVLLLVWCWQSSRVMLRCTELARVLVNKAIAAQDVKRVRILQHS